MSEGLGSSVATCSMGALPTVLAVLDEARRRLPDHKRRRYSAGAPAVEPWPAAARALVAGAVLRRCLNRASLCLSLGMRL